MSLVFSASFPELPHPHLDVAEEVGGPGFTEEDLLLLDDDLKPVTSPFSGSYILSGSRTLICVCIVTFTEHHHYPYPKPSPPLRNPTIRN